MLRLRAGGIEARAVFAFRFRWRTDDAGIDTIHVWAYPLSGAAPVFLGVASQGVSRPDVAAAYGEEFGRAGYQLNVQGLGAGDYDLAVFAWSRRLRTSA